MAFTLPKKTRILWQIRIFVIFALFVGAVCAFAGFTRWVFLPAGVITAVGLVAVFWYIPAAIKAFSVSADSTAVAVKSGVFFKNIHIMPNLRIVYAQTYETPVSRALSLKGVILRSARAVVLIPEMDAAEADRLMGITGSMYGTGGAQDAK